MNEEEPFAGEFGAQPPRIARARYATTSRPKFTNIARDETNSDEMAELNLGFESGVRAASSMRRVFPTSWSMFKPGSSSIGQQRRREEQLERYKDQKYQMLIKSRQMKDAFRAAGSTSANVNMEPGDSRNMDISDSRIESLVQSHADEMQFDVEVDAKFGNALMMPEYLSEIPPDFDKDWFCVPFPDGTRCTLIAKGGVTQARELDGTLLDEFQSQLPYGSGFMSSDSPDHCTLLDCVMVESGTIGFGNEDVTVVYFVLDMMAWNGYFYYNSNAESRAWMKTNWISEIDGLRTISKDNRAERNDRLILNLPAYQTTVDGMERACASPVQAEIAIDPKFHPIYRERTDSRGDVAGDEDWNHRDRPPTPSCYLHKHHIEFRVEGVMFYFKDMDYLNEQTSVMCLLPLAYARALLEDQKSANTIP